MTLMRALSNKLFYGASGTRRNNTNHLMIGRTQIGRTTIALLAVLSLSVTAVHAASINYGNFNIPAAGIMFQQVTESSGTDAVPQYGPPDPFVVGLDFDPTSFTSSSSNGSADISDGQLNFTIMGLVAPGGYVGVSGINLFEAGDYSIAGAGTAATSVTAGAILRATITQINGIAVAPINLLPVNASFSDSLPGAVVVAPWNLGLFVDVAGQLAGLGYGVDDVATKIEVAINNALVTTSEPGTVAFLAKKDFRIGLIPDPVGDPFIPEPSTFVLASLVACGLPLVNRRRQS
jgi:hypothetical protein